MRKWSFESQTECTAEDRALEIAINARLDADQRLGFDRGSVACYRDPTGYGLTYSYSGLHRELRRERFIADVDYWIAGLETLRLQMMNHVLDPKWTYDVEEADALVILE